MPPPSTTPSGAGGVIGNTPFIQPLSTPSTGFRTRQLHGPGYYHIGSPADQGYAEHMRAMFGRDDMDPPRQEPPRQEQHSMGVPAFPGSRIVPHATYAQVWLSQDPKAL